LFPVNNVMKELKMNYRTYKYKLKPNYHQSIEIDKNIENCSFLRKQLLSDIKEGVRLPYLETDKLKYYLDKYEQINRCDKNALLNEIFTVRDQENGRKIKLTKNSYTFSNLDVYRSKYPLKNDRVYLHSVGWVKKSKNRPIDESTKIRSFIVMKRKEEYYLFVNVTRVSQDFRELDINNLIAFDYSSTHFMIDNTGKQYDIPRFQRDHIKEISAKQKQLSNCVKGSNRYIAIQKQISSKYEKIRNTRKDYLHKLSTQIANKYDYVIVETLDIVEMSRSLNLAKATLDNCYAQFVEFLNYKLAEKNKKLIKISRWYPSTKTCHVCGYTNKNLKLSERSWICPKCKTLLDRDTNAAINIKNEGIRLIKAAGHSAAH